MLRRYLVFACLIIWMISVSLSAVESGRFMRDLAVTACFADSQMTAGSSYEPWCTIENQGQIQQVAKVSMRVYRNGNTQENWPNFYVQPIAPGAVVNVTFPSILMSNPDYLYRYDFSVVAQDSQPDDEPEDNSLSGRINTWTTPQQKVIVELATGSYLNIFNSCYGAIQGGINLTQTGANIALLNYQVTPPYASSGGDSRINSYGITSFPTAIFGGRYRNTSSSAEASLISEYYPLWQLAGQRKAPFQISIYGHHNAIWDDFTFRIDQQGYLDNDDLTINWAITEDNLPIDWMGFNHLDNVVRLISGRILPATIWNGTHIDLLENFPWDSQWVDSNCWITVFIQKGNTGEIIQANTVLVNQMQPPISVDDPIAEDGLRIYPNPGVNNFNVELQNVNEVDTKLAIYNLRGQKIRQLFTGKANAGKTIIFWDGSDDNGRSVGTGIYIIELNSCGTNRNYKVIVSK
ncbi:MAG TPA: T9SS type A sorting domain-containing protein [Candidatus Cloacimonadota bacterium]|nr:T9SS type A sorting domain-containing protein [Candidatus Cloacimonadota bacterium]